MSAGQLQYMHWSRVSKKISGTGMQAVPKQKQLPNMSLLEYLYSNEQSDRFNCVCSATVNPLYLILTTHVNVILIWFKLLLECWYHGDGGGGV